MARGGDGQVHSLRLLDRGASHVHRWHPTCVCGWVGKFRRRQHEACEMYRIHERARTGRGARAGARSLTPRAELPELLR